MTRRSLIVSLTLAACASPAAAPPPSVAPTFPAGGTAPAGDLSSEPRIVVTPTAVLVDGSAVEDIRGFDRARYLDGLAAQLKARSRPAEAFRSVTVEADRSAAIEAITSVLATAAGLRFSRVSLRVGGVSFNGDYWFPVVHAAPDRPTFTRVVLEVHAPVVRAAWQSRRSCASVADDASTTIDDLSAYLDRACPSGSACLDQVVVTGDDALSIMDVMRVLSAVGPHAGSAGFSFLISSGDTAERRCEDPIVGNGGHLPPELIQRVVRASFDTLRNCYTRGLAQTASLRGRVAVQFVIERDGHVGQAVLHDGTTMPDPVVSACVLGVFRTLAFPKPDLGDAKVVYPIQFDPAP
jgi:hypothetical protein